MMFTIRKRWKSLCFCLLAASSLTACGYADGGANTNRYNGPTTLDHEPIPADGYQNQYYTNQQYPTLGINGYNEPYPEMDNINDSPYLKAQQMRQQ